MQAIEKNHNIILDLNYEGPCVESIGLYTLLDKICESTKYDPSRITIKLYNLKESNNRYRIDSRIAETWFAQARLHQPSDKNITKHFGHFIGHGNRFRLAIGSYLYKNYKFKTLQTYHCDPTNPYHREFIGLEDLLFYKYDIQHFENACELLKHTPLTFDTIDSYPIKQNTIFNIYGAYQHIFVDIVCQAYYSGNCFQLDEKIWRPIAMKTPFMVQGPQNFIKNLQEIGFKTFSKWWDEGYSEDPPDCQVTPILKNIDQLSMLKIEEIHALYKEMQPILDHNHNLLMSLSNNNFQNLTLI